MNKIISELQQKNINFEILKGNLQFYINTLKDFQVDPDNTIKKIADGKIESTVKLQDSNVVITDLETLKSEFSDLKKGLEGEFTRTTSIDIAKRKLLSFLEKTLKTFSDSYTDIYTFINEPKEHLKEVYNVIDTNVDINALQKRKERYHRTNLERDFMQKTTIKVLTTKLANSSIQACAKGFLQKILEVLALIRTFEFKNIDKNVTIYYNRIANIKENFKNIGINGLFNTELAKMLNTIDDISGEQEFNKIMNSMKIEEDTLHDTLELLDLTIDDLELTVKQIKTNIDKLTEVCDNFVPSEFNTKYFVNELIPTVLTPYSNLELTDEKFFNSLQDFIVILENSNTVEVDLVRMIGNVITKLDNYIYIFNYVYGACEECTIKGTIISSGVEPNTK